MSLASLRWAPKSPRRATAVVNNPNGLWLADNAASVIPAVSLLEVDFANSAVSGRLNRSQLHAGQRDRVVAFWRGDDGRKAVAFLPDAYV